MKAVRTVVFAVLVASASLVSVSGCQNEVLSTTDGPQPIIRAVVVPKEVKAQATKTGDLIACCTADVSVTYDLPNGEFIRAGTIRWDDSRLAGATFRVIPSSLVADEEGDAGKSAGRSVSFSVDIPSSVTAKGYRAAFTITLISGRGAVSRSVSATMPPIQIANPSGT